MINYIVRPKNKRIYKSLPAPTNQRWGRGCGECWDKLADTIWDRTQLIINGETDCLIRPIGLTKCDRWVSGQGGRLRPPPIEPIRRCLNWCKKVPTIHNGPTVAKMFYVRTQIKSSWFLSIEGLVGVWGVCLNWTLTTAPQLGTWKDMANTFWQHNIEAV